MAIDTASNDVIKKLIHRRKGVSKKLVEMLTMLNSFTIERTIKSLDDLQ